MVVAITTKASAAGCALFFGDKLTREQTRELSTVTDEEKEALQALAPYAIEAFPAAAVKLGAVCVWAFAGLVAMMVTIRLAVLRVVYRQPKKEKAKDARGNVVRRDDRNGKDARGTGGPESAAAPEGVPGPGMFEAPGERAAGGPGFPQGSARGKPLGTRDG